MSEKKSKVRVRRDKHRFRLVRLEERIAPSKNGWNNPKNPHYVDPYTGTSICPY